MQLDKGLRSLLTFPLIYRLANLLFTNRKFQRWFIDDVIAVRSGQKLVDIGCGPADLLDGLPAKIEYVGVDISSAYIEAARTRYGVRGVFVDGSIGQWKQDVRCRNADVAVAYGLLHHLDDDEATEILIFAREILKPGGRLVLVEPCYLLWQSGWSRWMMGQDRGRNVRSENQWKALLRQVFPDAATNIITNGNRLGYTHLIGSCTKLA
jgi:SAM-dependent methyltransferase